MNHLLGTLIGFILFLIFGAISASGFPKEDSSPTPSDLPPTGTIVGIWTFVARIGPVALIRAEGELLPTLFPVGFMKSLWEYEQMMKQSSK